MKSKDYTDYLIIEEVKKEYEEAPNPPLSKEETWRFIRSSLRTKKEVWKKNKYRLAVSAIVCIIISASFLLPYSKGYTMTWLSQYITLAKEHTLQIFGFIDQSESKNIPNLAKVQEFIINENISLAEAASRTNFEILVPDLPELQLEAVQVSYTNSSQDIIELKLTYKHNQGDIIFEEGYYDKGISFSKSIDTEDTTMMQLEINGNQASLLMFKNGRNLLEILYPNTRVVIQSDINVDEIEKIARSLREY